MRGMSYASLAWLASAGLSLADPGLKAPVDYARDIEPVLKARCFECHGPARQRGGYRLDVRASATGSGDSGAKGIVPGKSAESPRAIPFPPGRPSCWPVGSTPGRPMAPTHPPPWPATTGPSASRRGPPFPRPPTHG